MLYNTDMDKNRHETQEWVPVVVETGSRIYYGADTTSNALANEQTMVGQPGNLTEVLAEATRQAYQHEGIDEEEA